MSQHTPGPWQVDSVPGGHVSFEINSTDAKWKAVANVSANRIGAGTVDPNEAEANARLIAAAPDMYAELQKLTQILITIREEQVSASMGFGRTAAEKKERATFYAVAIQANASKIDEATEAALSALAKAEGRTHETG